MEQSSHRCRSCSFAGAAIVVGTASAVAAVLPCGTPWWGMAMTVSLGGVAITGFGIGAFVRDVHRDIAELNAAIKAIQMIGTSPMTREVLSTYSWAYSTAAHNLRLVAHLDHVRIAIRLSGFVAPVVAIAVGAILFALHLAQWPAGVFDWLKFNVFAAMPLLLLLILFRRMDFPQPAVATYEEMASVVHDAMVRMASLEMGIKNVLSTLADKGPDALIAWLISLRNKE